MRRRVKSERAQQRDEEEAVYNGKRRRGDGDTPSGAVL